MPTSQKIALITTSLLSILAYTFLNTSFVIMTNLGIWVLSIEGVIDSDWSRVFTAYLTYWIDDYYVQDYVNDIIQIPFRQIKFIIQKLDPGNNEDFYFLFVLLVYPILYLITQQLSLVNLTFIPWIAGLYVVSTSMFVDHEATEEFNNKWLIPELGFPKWWAQYYAINAILWGDFRYIDFTQPLEISFIQFPKMWFWSLWQFLMSPLTFLPFVIWSVLAISAIYLILFYDIGFTNNR